MKLFGSVCCVVAVLACVVEGYERAIQRPYPKSCRDVPVRDSGVYTIQPEWPFQEPLRVYCDQDYEHGGWTVVQRRSDGTLDFERDLVDYVQGFGSVDAEFWLGLESIYRLAKSEPHELLVWLKDFAGNTFTARYSHLNVQKNGPQWFLFLNCGSYSGTAGNVFCQDGGQFVPQHFNGGGFWDDNRSNLNGRYVSQGDRKDGAEGLYWGDIRAGSIRATKMMVRPRAPRD